MTEAFTCAVVVFNVLQVPFLVVKVGFCFTFLRRQRVPLRAIVATAFCVRQDD